MDHFSGDDPIHGFYASLANYMKSNPSEARLRDDFNRKYLLILNVILQDPSRDQLFGMPEFLEIIEYIWVSFNPNMNTFT